jgi:hypothetical protein
MKRKKLEINLDIHKIREEKETKLKKYRNIRNKLKEKKIGKKTIVEIETELSEQNRKTLKIRIK